MPHRESLIADIAESRLPDIARIFMVMVIAVMSALTVLTHICQIAGISFSLYAIIGACVIVVIIGWVLRTELSRQLLRSVIARPSLLIALLACCVFGSLLSLMSHRPDSDDTFYVPNVIYYLEHPDESMGFEAHFIDSGFENEKFVAYHRCSIPFEYSQGILAYIASTHLLNIYYFLGPALFGFMIPLTWFYLISRFSLPVRSAIAGAFFTCLSLLLMGEQHRSFGNFAFNRIFQGKTVMLAVGLPFFAGLTMDFFRSRSIRTWIYLFVTSTAMIGATVSTAALIPMFAFVLAVSCSFSYLPNMKERFIRSFSYFCTLLYPALYALSIILVSMNQLGADKAINKVWPTTFYDNICFVAGPVVTLFVIIGTVFSIKLIQKHHRRFLALWFLLPLVCYLNPLVFPFILRYVTSPNIYWRVFYLIPFPLVVGLASAALLSKLENKNAVLWYAAFTIAAAFFLATHLPTSSSSVFRSKIDVTKLNAPEYKLNKVHLARARQVLEMKPPAGSMLAVPDVSMTLVLLTSKYPQMFCRPDGIEMWMEEYNRIDEGVRRIEASFFLNGQMTRKGFESLIWIIQNNAQIRSIVSNRQTAEASNSYLVELLGKLGFSEYNKTDDLFVFVRRQEMID